MNFYLSAVDDLLRHQDDEPSTAIVLCGGKNELVVEYALRDTSKPTRVAQYLLSPAPSDNLQRELPTIDELSSDFPAMSVAQIRMDAKRALRSCYGEERFPSERPTSIGLVLHDLKQRGIAPASSDQFLEALRIINEIAHGLDVDPDAAAHAIDIGKTFLAELSDLDK